MQNIKALLLLIQKKSSDLGIPERATLGRVITHTVHSEEIAISRPLVASETRVKTQMPTAAQQLTEINVMNKVSDIQAVVGIQETANPAKRWHL